MKIRVYYVLSGDIVGTYTLTYEGDDVSPNQVENLIRQAKRKYKLPGKVFTLMAAGKVFHAVKTKKVWKVYQLKEAENEQEN